MASKKMTQEETITDEFGHKEVWLTIDLGAIGTAHRGSKHDPLVVILDKEPSAADMEAIAGAWKKAEAWASRC